jgi:hypothetical protein
LFGCCHACDRTIGVVWLAVSNKCSGKSRKKRKQLCWFQ